MKKKALMVVSFGTTYEEQRRNSLGGIEEALSNHYPDRECFVAYTSGMIRRIYWTKRGIKISSVTEQMNHCLKEGYEDILVVVTHMMWGHEYEKVRSEIVKACEAYENDGNLLPLIRISRPLSTTAEDRKLLAQGMMEDYKQLEEAYDGIVFMGHGSSHANTVIYEEIQAYLAEESDRYWLRTVEGELTFDPEAIIDGKSKDKSKGSYLLAPFMIVAGDHATNDLAGANDESWKHQLESMGCTVETNLVGLGERPWIRKQLIALSEDAKTID